MKAELISSDYISNHRYFTARKDAYRLPSGKIVDPYYLVEIPRSATAMALTDDNKIIFVSQYRHPVGEVTIELPGGFIDSGEDPEIAIRRELKEETGYEFETLIHLGTTAANPGILNNYTELFLLTGGRKTTEQSLDDNEEIDVILKTPEEAESLLMQSKIIQSMHALCLFYGFQKLRSQEI